MISVDMIALKYQNLLRINSCLYIYVNDKAIRMTLINILLQSNYALLSVFCWWAKLVMLKIGSEMSYHGIFLANSY